MSISNNLDIYLEIAKGVMDSAPDYETMQSFVSTLPDLDSEDIEYLFLIAKKESIKRPNYAWLIFQVVDSVAEIQRIGPFVRGMVAWYLGWLANEWTRPLLVNQAVHKAKNQFRLADHPGWEAACSWLENAQPWTRSSFLDSKKELDVALKIMMQEGVDDWIPQARLSLAFAELLTGGFDQAHKLTVESEQVFIQNNDQINIGRAWLNYANILRRKGEFQDALAQLNQALELFQQIDAPIDIGKVYYQIGINWLLKGEDYNKAVHFLETAQKIFEVSEMDLWDAQCQGAIAQIAANIGGFKNAFEYRQKAIKTYQAHNVIGLQADSLNDQGKLHFLGGELLQALNCLEQAENLYRRLGAMLYVGNALANQGRVLIQQARYQNALVVLERSREILAAMNNLSRLAFCDLQLSKAWFGLGNMDIAHDYIEKVLDYHAQMGKGIDMATAYQQKISISIQRKDYQQARNDGLQAIDFAKQAGALPELARAQRLFGWTLLQSGEVDLVLESLKKAQELFISMGMTLDHALTIAMVGQYYIEINEHDKARQVWKQALETNKSIMPEVDLQAHLGLARLAEDQNAQSLAADHYEHVLSTLVRIKHQFWQPRVAGQYSQITQQGYHRGIVFAFQSNNEELSLEFIDNAKAQSLLRQLSVQSRVSVTRESEALSELRAEINWLQEKISKVFQENNQIKAIAQTRELQIKFQNKLEEYNQLAEKVERELINAPLSSGNHSRTNLHTELKNTLTDDWIFLNYYLANDDLYLSWITNKNIHLYQTKLTSRFKMALKNCQWLPGSTNKLSLRDLTVLADELIPQEIRKYLKEDTQLIISPYDRLHLIPWGALYLKEKECYLMEVGLLTIAPSIQTILHLAQSNITKESKFFENGLLLSVSDFSGRFPDLVDVEKESKGLKALFPQTIKDLANQEATWENLQEVKMNLNKNSGLDFFHIATHFFHDVRTGRLSGIALWEENLWLDQLSELGPLPRLVTISGCNGIQSRIYDGDEHIGLPTTCLLSGANYVIGSLWPVFDHSGTEIVLNFYRNLRAGASPSKAITATQRQAHAEGIPWEQWGGFGCIGFPQ